jgi:long-chain fatty acid transport protein
MTRNFRVCLHVTSALSLLVVATQSAGAGAFSVREQGAYAQGTSYAGIAAGGDLSAIFWNPAAVTQINGKAVEVNASAIFPHASQSYTNSGLATGLGGFMPAYLNGVQKSIDKIAVPSFYASWQLSQQFWLGLSVNAPFGLGVSFPQFWAGGFYGQDADLKTYNFSPTIALKINDMFSIAAGPQVQYMHVNYGLQAFPFPPSFAAISGHGYSYGWVVGATITPTRTTTIGIGYRSAVDQKIDGALEASTLGSTPGSISTTLKLPGVLTVGLRQGISDRFTLLAGFEWSNWSRIGTSTIVTPTGTAMVSGVPVLLPFQYSDGYLYSVGGEYAVDPAFTLRAGIAFEQSPITDSVRTPLVPDNNRVWYSAGLSYMQPQNRGLKFHFAYSYIDVNATTVSLGPGTNNPWSIGPLGALGAYAGSVNSHINIFSCGISYQWGASENKIMAR